VASAVDHVGMHARLQPDRLAAWDLAGDRRWNYRDLDRTIAQCAAVLTARGVGPGDRVATLAKNRVGLVALHLACARIGAVYVPLNWRLSAREIAEVIADAEPVITLGDASLEAGGVEGASLDAFFAEADVAEPFEPQVMAPDQASLILYTSGTSGRAKGAVLSERNLTETAINFSLLGEVDRDSVVLCDAPMFHVIGLVTNIRPVLMRGGTIVVSDGFVPARTLQRLADPKLAVTHYFCVPQMAAMLRAEPGFDPSALRGLKAIFTGGAPHPEAAIRAWLADGVAIVDGYGMTEAGTVLGMPLDPALIAARAGSAGVAAPGVQTRIVDAEGRDAAPGAAGELLLRGANVMAGYWHDETQTASAFTADGWFRTGDIARADAQGFHWLIDRRKDMFISGGENVYPAEIEALLAGRPDIAECAVVGVPDATWGEVGHLVLVAAPGRTPDAQEILAALAAGLARYKTPKHVSIVAALPRNGAGKILKSELKKSLAVQADNIGRG
jgi:fatty-acyl-CoA synthase